MINFTELIACN
jgi:hypothetical protein